MQETASFSGKFELEISEGTTQLVSQLQDRKRINNIQGTKTRFRTLTLENSRTENIPNSKPAQNMFHFQSNNNLNNK